MTESELNDSSGGPKRMRVGVTGGRNFFDLNVVRFALGQMPADAVLVHGRARGADSTCAKWWGDIHGRTVEAHPADWKKHGKSAGPIRNQEMVDSGLDVLVVFPGGIGTADMKRRAMAAEVPIFDMSMQRSSGLPTKNDSQREVG